MTYIREISVVIPAYRAEKLIGRSINSVMAEGISPKNIIVVEDGVTDNTGLVVQSYSARSYQLEHNRGACYARNFGLRMVKTPYAMFLDADDYILGGLMQSFQQELESNFDILIGPWLSSSDLEPFQKVRVPDFKTEYELVSLWLYRKFYPTCSVLWRCEALNFIGGWNEVVQKNQDGELMVRAICSGLSAKAVTGGLGVYWQHSSQFRVSSASIEKKENANIVIYKHLINQNNVIKLGNRDIGRFCKKNAWDMVCKDNLTLAKKWENLAKHHGYYYAGHDFVSSFLVVFLGHKRSKRVLSYINKFISISWNRNSAWFYTIKICKKIVLFK